MQQRTTKKLLGAKTRVSGVNIPGSRSKRRLASEAYPRSSYGGMKRKKHINQYFKGERIGHVSLRDMRDTRHERHQEHKSHETRERHEAATLGPMPNFNRCSLVNGW